jgi:menaquinone-specific isochorismate synthase
MDVPRGDEATVRTVDAPVVTRGCSVSTPPTRAFLATNDRPRYVWQTPTESVAVRGATATVTGDGSDRFADVRADGARLLESCAVPDGVPTAARPRLFGGFAFHDDGQAGPWDGFGDARFVLPEVQLTGSGDDWWLTVTAAGSDADSEADSKLDVWRDRLADETDPVPAGPPGVADRTRTPSRSGWREQVEAALRSVSEGALEKVVLAQAMTLSLSNRLSVPDALERLGRTYPDCYRFAFSPTEDATFFGATPERLVSLTGRTVSTEALAGSTGRGDTPAEDEWLATELLESEKDGYEHEVVADAIREQLEPFASSVGTGDRSVRRLATVQHLRTPISAELAGDEHVLSLVEALHPTPAVGGLPPDAALETIRETETFDRGWYAAPVGWFDASGNGTFAVAIRSALARGDAATVFAGAGIVADSDPDREWDEVQLKYRPMLDELE